VTDGDRARQDHRSTDEALLHLRGGGAGGSAFAGAAADLEHDRVAVRAQYRARGGAGPGLCCDRVGDWSLERWRAGQQLADEPAGPAVGGWRDRKEVARVGT